MTHTDPAARTDAPRSALRCSPLPPLNIGLAESVPVSRRPAGLPMLRRGLLVLAALALPALGAPLADPVHRARLPQATQAAAAPRSPLKGAAAALTEIRGARIILSALDASNPVVRP